MEVVNIKDFERESKKRAFKEKVHAKIQNGKEWVMKNKEAVLTLTTVVIGGMSLGRKDLGSFFFFFNLG